MGETVPLPASYEMMSALTQVKVINDDEKGDGFEMIFTLGKDNSGDYSLLNSGRLSPFTRVVIGVLLGVSPEVLIDGVITHHEVTPSNEPGHSILTVKGTDIGIMLDLKEKNEKYENQPDSVIFSRIIGNYTRYGLVPQPTPTKDVPIMILRIPRQQETDLQFIRRMAKRNGFVFYIEPLTFGASRAYFGPENRLGIPQAALSMNMGPHTNVKELSFSQDGLAPTGTEGSFVEPLTKTSLPIPPLPSLRLPPFASRSTAAKRTTVMRDTANQNPTQAATSALAAATQSPDAIGGQGALDTVRYGNVLRARRLVGVRGAGKTYDGNYYVSRAAHTLGRGTYTQEFKLKREGTGALLPVVRP
jgi:phage protein D